MRILKSLESVNVEALKYVCDERTKEDAMQEAKYFEEENPEYICIIYNLTGKRARTGFYDKPWNVRAIMK